MITLTAENFAEQVLESDKPVLVDFWADWCGPCKMIAPVLEEIEAEYGDRLTIAKLNADEYPEITAKYGVLGLPTLNLYKGARWSSRSRAPSPSACSSPTSKATSRQNRSGAASNLARRERAKPDRRSPADGTRTPLRAEARAVRHRARSGPGRVTSARQDDVSVTFSPGGACRTGRKLSVPAGTVRPW